METFAKLSGADNQLLLATPFQLVDLNDEASCAEAVTCWTETTSRGGEGMVVKPLNFIAEGRRGITQPAIKCRGPEYLRIIYGPEYLLPQNLERLRSRNVGAKRSLAFREFALGVEALDRFVRKEPLRRTHECVFGIRAFEEYVWTGLGSQFVHYTMTDLVTRKTVIPYSLLVQESRINESLGGLFLWSYRFLRTVVHSKRLFPVSSRCFLRYCMNGVPPVPTAWGFFGSVCA